MDGVCILDLLSFRRFSCIAQLKSRIVAERTPRRSKRHEFDLRDGAKVVECWGEHFAKEGKRPIRFLFVGPVLCLRLP
jgi:hypothetical protein